MATINTIHDLFQLLRDNPEWADELRRLVLTTELIDLPRKFEEFAEETRTHSASSDAAFNEFVNETFQEFVEETRAHSASSDAAFNEFVNETFQEFVEETRAHSASSDAAFNEFVNETFNDFVEESRTRQDAAGRRFNDFVNETHAHNSATDATIKVIQDDIGELKGSNAMNTVLARPDLIVFALSEDLLIEKILTAQDIGAMIRSRQGVVPQDARMSFVQADLLIHAKDSDGEDHYIAAEVSYTVGSSDVDRAIRNAKFLGELTDKEAHAIVVGSEINGTAAMIIEREGVPWYQLRRRDTRPR